MLDRISFRCPACKVRLRVSPSFVGRSCICPKCREPLVVPPNVPSEEEPLLVLDDGYRLPRR
jgi:hypothetical protein